MQLPEKFTERMKWMLGDAYESFTEEYEKEQKQALRVNPLKITIEEFQKIQLFSLTSIPWVKTGFYYEKKDRPGKHPFHEAGLYYIQEPSAMAVGEACSPKPGEYVLDLCAAPGGKTTHLAGAMKGKGLLISNEIHPARAKILAQNVERMGIRNAVVTNESPEKLAKKFPEFFDRIVVDAPCSGEGMFRKEEQALEHWSEENVALCADRQKEILKQAAKMLLPGGTLVYSTCTFAPDENEGSIAWFLKEYPEFSVVMDKFYDGFSDGVPNWADGNESLTGTMRLWPHKIAGEGHYIAVLHKAGMQERKETKGAFGELDKTLKKQLEAFEKTMLKEKLTGYPILFKDQICYLPCKLDLKGLKVLRAGLHVASVKKNRLEPEHALALALSKEEALHTCEIEEGLGLSSQYLRGEALNLTASDGWQLVLINGYSIGWGKYSAGILKNHYPKGLRK